MEILIFFLNSVIKLSGKIIVEKNLNIKSTII